MERTRLIRGASASDERGIALVLVLWVLVLLALLSAAFLASTQSEMAIVRARIDAARAEAIADGGVHWAAARILEASFAGDDAAASAVFAGSEENVELGQGIAHVRIQDVGGLVDLNGADKTLLAGLIAAVGGDPETARQLADRIVDFRDRDDRPEPSGAEDADYRAAGLAYDAKDAPFERVDEVRQVLGMPPALAARLLPYLTVHSASHGVDPRTAPAGVLAALPGLGQAVQERVLSARARAAGAAFDPGDSPYFIASSRNIFRIEVVGESDTGGRFLRQAVIRIGGSDQGFEILDWRQGEVTAATGE